MGRFILGIATGVALACICKKKWTVNILHKCVIPPVSFLIKPNKKLRME